MKNKLNLKHFDLQLLGIGESCIVGPYNKPNSGSTLIVRASRAGDVDKDFTQKQMPLLDMENGVIHKIT